jgi:oligosaccharide repeat unit polymerase
MLSDLPAVSRQHKVSGIVFAAILGCIGLGLLIGVNPALTTAVYTNPIPLIILITGCLLMVAFYLLWKDWLIPPLPFLAIWTLSLFLVNIDVEYVGFYSFFNQPLSPKTWLVVLGAILGFVGGSLYVLTLPEEGAASFLSDRTIRGWDDTKVRRAIWGSFGGGTAVFAYSVFRAGLVPLFASQVYLARINFRPPFWNNFFALFMVVITLAAVRLATVGWRKSLDTTLLAIFSFIIYLLSTQRNDAWQSFLIASVVFLALQQWQSKAQPQAGSGFPFKKLFWPAVALLVLVIAFVQVGEARQLQTTQIVNIPNRSVAQLYLYTGAPAIKNLQRVLHGEVQVQDKGGLLLLRPLLWYLRVREPVTVYNVFAGPNVATFLYFYYLDFGVMGTLLIPLGLGLVCTLVYRRARRLTSPLWAIWYGLLISCIIWTQTSERFFEPSTVWYAVLFALVHLYCQQAREETAVS